MDNTKSPSTAMETAFTCSHTLWSAALYMAVPAASTAPLEASWHSPFPIPSSFAQNIAIGSGTPAKHLNC